MANKKSSKVKTFAAKLSKWMGKIHKESNLIVTYKTEKMRLPERREWVRFAAKKRVKRRRRRRMRKGNV